MPSRSPKMETDFDVYPPLLKGVPAFDIIEMLAEGKEFKDIRRKWPQLGRDEVDAAIRFRDLTLIPSRLFAGKSRHEVAEEFGLWPSQVSAIKRKADARLRAVKVWGGLSHRAVAVFEKLGYRSLKAVKENPPAEDEVFMTKGAGFATFAEIKKAVALKPGKEPVEVLYPAGRPPEDFLAEPPEALPGESHCCVTKAGYFKKALDDPCAPAPARKMARFIDAVVKSAEGMPFEELLPSDIPCMAGPQPRRWCLGVVDISWRANPWRIRWECPLCGKQGVVTGVEPSAPPAGEPGERLH